MQPPPNDDIDRESLVAFYMQIGDEIKRLRDEHWRLTTYFVSEAIGVIYLIYNDHLRALITGPMLVFIFWLQASAIAMFMYHMFRTHRMLNTNRQIRRSVEQAFGLHKLRDVENRPVLPSVWRHAKVSRWFEFYQVIIPLVAFTVLVQMLSMYLVYIAL